MPTTFRILPTHGIVYITHSGHVTVAESRAAMAEYSKHPDCAPGQRHLVDCADVTSFEKNYSQVMEIQARMADIVTPDQPQTLLVFYAPTPVAMELATLVCNSWDCAPPVVARIATTEHNALSILGQTETRFSDIFTTA